MNTWQPRYHVPQSQVWAGSRGGQSGNVHLHYTGTEPLQLTTNAGRRATIARSRGATLCQPKKRGWYERELWTRRRLWLSSTRRTHQTRAENPSTGLSGLVSGRSEHHTWAVQLR